MIFESAIVQDNYLGRLSQHLHCNFYNKTTEMAFSLKTAFSLVLRLTLIWRFGLILREEATTEVGPGGLNSHPFGAKQYLFNKSILLPIVEYIGIVPLFVSFI